MKTQITAFFMAWGMFLSIPCPCKIWDEKARPWQLVYLPVAGLLVGALWALAAYALGSFDRLPALRAAVLAALPFLLTGFLHLDGFMDCCDAILSRRDLPTRQKILKDSHVGSFAVVCTIFLMLAAFAAFWDFDAKEGWQGLLLLPVFSRFASSFCVFACRPMQTSQYASGFEAAQHKHQLTAQDRIRRRFFPAERLVCKPDQRARGNRRVRPDQLGKAQFCSAERGFCHKDCLLFVTYGRFTCCRLS